jgi:UDP-N-acetylmuramyl tripeptide synthase
MKEQNAAKPVWRWNVVGDEVEVDVESDVESDGARFSAGAAAAGAAVAVVEPDISLHRRSQIVLTASRGS